MSVVDEIERLTATKLQDLDRNGEHELDQPRSFFTYAICAACRS
jgi:hypothetical protein